MSGYKHLLLALDFEADNQVLLERAKDLADRYQAGLTLIHVIEIMIPSYAGDMPLPEDFELEEVLAKRAWERLKDMAGKLGLEKVDCRVEKGVPKHEITRTAENLDIDLILVGSHGRHGIQLVLGSTANGVLHLAGCDVLAVRMKGPAR